MTASIHIDPKNMSRDEAIALVGMAAVTAAESDNCVPTDRAYDHDEGEIEWAGWAGVDYDTLTPEQIYQLPVDGCRIRAIYYTGAADAEQVECNGGDWGMLTWIVHHYEIY